MDIVLAMTGASGTAYATRLLEVLLRCGHRVQLVISPAAAQVAMQECGLSLDLDQFDIAQLLPEGAPEGEQTGSVRYHRYNDFMSAIASGSSKTAGMVICPCSMGTLGALAAGLSSNLIHRAAHVHLKEQRKLILVPRETPLSVIQLDNMKRLAEAGAVMLPAMPGFYHRPTGIDDLVDFVVGRICDQLGLDVDLHSRWGSDR